MNVKAELKRLGIRPSKRLGQNFLFDENLAKKIVYELHDNETIIEIGPGLGILTKYLLERFQNPIFIEKDPSLYEYLKSLHPDANIIQGDVLKFNFNQLDSFSIIANLPYSVSKKILRIIISIYPRMEEAVLMLQKEVAERLASPKGTKQYGISTVLTRIFYEVAKLFNVSNNVFYPKPAVDSTVIKLTKRSSTVLNKNEYEEFIRFVKAVFSGRRKKISTNLGISAKIDKRLNLRAEDLAPEELVELYRRLKTTSE